MMMEFDKMENSPITKCLATWYIISFIFGTCVIPELLFAFDNLKDYIRNITWRKIIFCIIFLPGIITWLILYFIIFFLLDYSMWEKVFHLNFLNEQPFNRENKK